MILLSLHQNIGVSKGRDGCPSRIMFQRVNQNWVWVCPAPKLLVGGERTKPNDHVNNSQSHREDNETRMWSVVETSLNPKTRILKQPKPIECSKQKSNGTQAGARNGGAGHLQAKNGRLETLRLCRAWLQRVVRCWPSMSSINSPRCWGRNPQSVVDPPSVSLLCGTNEQSFPNGWHPTITESASLLQSLPGCIKPH